MERTFTKTLVCTNIKTKTIATIIAIISAVALPQVFHVIGAYLGLSTALGEIFLPMHIAVLFIGLLAGGTAGALCGALAPLLSWAITGMPSLTMLPYITIELFAYGLVIGLLAKSKLPSILKLVIAQVVGRVIKGIALVLGFYFLGDKVNPSVIWKSIYVALPGLVLQWTLIPLAYYLIQTKAKNELQ